MPEGPEIHRAADKIRKALEGKVIENIEITLPKYEGRESDFLGKMNQQCFAPCLNFVDSFTEKIAFSTLILWQSNLNIFDDLSF